MKGRVEYERSLFSEAHVTYVFELDLPETLNPKP